MSNKKEFQIPLPFGAVAESKFANKTFAWIKIIFFLSLAFAYFSWTMDLIPVKVAGPVVGHIDDAIIFLLVAWTIRGSIKVVLGMKGRFIGGK